MQAKVCMVGPKGVGKSTLASRIDSTKVAELSTASGIKFAHCNVSVGEKTLDLHIQDLSGEEELRCMGPIFYKQAKAALCVFDLTSRQSFECIGEWIKGIKNNAADECILIIVGNKVDLHERMVDKKEGKKYAESIGAKYFEVSALSGKGILSVLVYLAKKLIRLSDCYVSYVAKLSITSNTMGWCLPETTAEKRQFSLPIFKTSQRLIDHSTLYNKNGTF